VKNNVNTNNNQQLENKQLRGFSINYEFDPTIHSNQQNFVVNEFKFSEISNHTLSTNPVIATLKRTSASQAVIIFRRVAHNLQNISDIESINENLSPVLPLKIINTGRANLVFVFASIQIYSVGEA